MACPHTLSRGGLACDNQDYPLHFPAPQGGPPTPRNYQGQAVSALPGCPHQAPCAPGPLHMSLPVLHYPPHCIFRNLHSPFSLEASCVLYPPANQPTQRPSLVCGDLPPRGKPSIGTMSYSPLHPGVWHDGWCMVKITADGPPVIDGVDRPGICCSQGF